MTIVVVMVVTSWELILSGCRVFDNALAPTDAWVPADPQQGLKSFDGNAREPRYVVIGKRRR
ncbi:hypothetical protein [Streptomyces sp. CA-106110]|uniref:hypothetical protein n=1 Tax=Streptomyces sp. CA-106110 TaxID=3240044 RepID=UPI003D8E94F7